MTDQVLEGEAVEVGAEVVPAPSGPPPSLFHTNDPAEVLEKASKTADALKSVLVKQGLTSNIQGREHVRVEGWTTLGAMLGVTPVCDWTRPVAEPAKGWEARVEARTMDGRVIGAAEAMCLTSESTWENRDDYAIRSMAQTRATSKALASVLRFIVTLAGYEGTPAEEMPSDGGVSRGGDRKGFSKQGQRFVFEKALKKHCSDSGQVTGASEYANATKTPREISRLIDALDDEEKGAENATKLLAAAQKHAANDNTEISGPVEPESEAHDPSIPF